MPNCLLFEKFDLHYALCHFDSILLHYAKLFIRQSIDREQIFDVTFETHLPPLKNPAYALGSLISEVYTHSFETSFLRIKYDCALSFGRCQFVKMVYLPLQEERKLLVVNLLNSAR